MAIPNAQDGAQYSVPIVATTSAAASASYGFRANMVFFRASSTGGTCYIDLTGGTATLATTSASYPLLPSGTLGPFYIPYKTGYFTGFSVISPTGNTVFPLALL